MAGCPLTSSWPMTTLHAMRRLLTLFTGFLIPKSLVSTWSPEHNSLGGKMPVFQYYVLLLPTIGQPERFFQNPPFFPTPLQLQTNLPASLQGAH